MILSGYTYDGKPTEKQEEVYEEAMSPEWAERIRETYKHVFGSQQCRITEDELTDMLEGMYDTHIHAAPDSYGWRVRTEADVARKAIDYKFGGLVFKGQGAPTSYRQAFVKELADIYAQQNEKKSIDIFGGVCCASQVGGYNPAAVEASFMVGGKYVWTPSKDSDFQHIVEGNSKPGIKCIDENGNLIPEIHEIFKMIAENDGVLGISHQSTRERFMMIELAQKMGIKRIVLEHVQMHITRMSIPQLKEAAKKGVYLGLAAVAGYCNYVMPHVDNYEAINWIKEIGAEHFIAQTDMTQLQNPDPIEGIRIMAKILLSQGLPIKDLQAIYVKNPHDLLY